LSILKDDFKESRVSQKILNEGVLNHLEQITNIHTDLRDFVHKLTADVSVLKEKADKSEKDIFDVKRRVKKIEDHVKIEA
jgi:predicted nuclease with TOPRIM domain